MNNELYLNETTKVGIVVQDENELKTVESSENEDTVKILSLQNKIERENNYVSMFKEQLKKSKDNIKWKNRFFIQNIFMILITIFIGRNILGEVRFYKTLFGILFAANAIIILYEFKSYSLLGTYKENRLNIKELPKEIKKLEEKIKCLEEELKNLKEKSNYNEVELTNEDAIKFAAVNYPERTNDETLVSDIQIPAKIKKITFDHNGTTK